MQLQQVNSSQEIKSAGDDGGSNVPSQPVILERWDFSSADRDEVLALLNPACHRERSIWTVAGARVVGFGLGWAGSVGWYSPASISAFNKLETPSHRSAETKLGRKTEAARKPVSTLALRSPPDVSQHSGSGVRSAAKPLAASSDEAVDASSIGSLAIPTDPTSDRFDSADGADNASARDETNHD